MLKLRRRVIHSIAVLLGVSLITFFVAHTTGDPLDLIVPANTPEETREMLREHMGLDKPLVQQYGLFVANALRGDLGTSFVYNRPVTELIGARLGNTLKLAGAAFVLALISGIGLGVLAALKRNTWIDTCVTAISMLGFAVPPFWLGLMLILALSVRAHLFPVSGSDGLAALVLPAVTLSMQMMARLSRLVRSGMIEVLQSDFVRTARAKGLSEARVIWGHAFRNALLPVITMAGLELGDLISSAVVIEVIFAWPGIGRLAVEAVSTRDFPLIQGTVLVAATCFVVINGVVDWLYTRIDPRVNLR